MPIHNLGYREWEGQRLSGRSRWSVIAGIGIRRAWQSKWLRRIAFVVWGPPLAYGILIFLFERFLTAPTAANARIAQDVMKVFLPGDAARALSLGLNALDNASAEQMLSVVRPMFWKAVLLQLQRSQLLGMVIVVGLVAPPLISQDVRSRAFLLYFSRPLTRLQYIGGKFATVASFLVLICTLPQLLLYVFAVMLSPDISVVAYTWDLPLRAVLASATMIIPATLLALMLSSLTTETRFATFGWFTIWIFGLAAYVVLLNGTDDTSQVFLRLGFLFLLFSDLSMGILDLTSNIRNLPDDLGIPAGLEINGGVISRDMFDITSLTPHFETQLAFAAALSVICFAVIFRRVSAPLNA